MSKQSSVEWLFEQQFNSFEKFNNGEFSFAEYMTHNLKLRQQAKAMHKEDHKQFIKNYFEWHKSMGFVSHKPEDIDEYYNETFMGNNENNI